MSNLRNERVAIPRTLHGKYKYTVFTLGHCILYNTLYSVSNTLYSDKLDSRRETRYTVFKVPLRCIYHVGTGPNPAQMS